MMPYITAFCMPRSAVIARCDSGWLCQCCILGQFAELQEIPFFTTEYSVRTAMEAVYGLCGVDSRRAEVWGSVYDIRELLEHGEADGRKIPTGNASARTTGEPEVEAGEKSDRTEVGKLLREHGW